MRWAWVHDPASRIDVFLESPEVGSMKVKLLTGMAGKDFSHAPGQVVDLDSATAKRLLESGQAEPVAEKRASKAERRVVKPEESRG